LKGHYPNIYLLLIQQAYPPTTHHNGNFTNRRGRGPSHRPGPCGCVRKTGICQLPPLVDAAAGGADTFPCTTCTCHWHTPVFGTVRPNNDFYLFIVSSLLCFLTDTLRSPLLGRSCVLSTHYSIHKYASCSKECFILALIYIDRLIQRNNFLLTDLNVHRVVITSVLLAAKFFDDAYYNNAYYAKVGGVLVEEMNNLETQFLFKIDFSLRVLPEVFEKYEAELVSHANDMGLQRIAFTTDAELFASASAVSTSSTQQLTQQQQHVTAQEHQLQQMMVAAESRTPLLQQQQQTFVAATTSGETEFQDYSFINPMVWPQEQHYHQEQQKREPTFMETLDPIYSFPPTPLPGRVSAYQEQYPTITQPVHDDVMGATLQYVDHKFKYSSQAMGMTDAAASNAAYSPHSKGEKHSGLSMMMTEALYYFPPTQDFNCVTASTSSHSQQQQQESSDYLAQYATTTSGITYNNYNNLNRVIGYPEITPSPPPQPPINVHGLPVYDESAVGGPYVKLPSRDGGVTTSSCGGVAYLTTSSSSGIAMALGRSTVSDDHQYYSNHHHHNPTNNTTMQSHPIAICGSNNCHQYHHHQLVPQDNSNGGWSMLSQVLEKSASLSGSA